ncbi:AMP-binding protein [Coxiella burnetii]|uniref:AMP-binding protein n=1 Tax=Coxiella burnetii TaxID=777 RepID=UPI0000183AF4|nr:AMP-binding protein [Coxiella burnetii]ARI66482.1 AMP-binding protein [Coxiella burnetii]ARK27929.1 AMP-binding protein [Coxiella burnetii]MCF2094654.1 AMP-binding protein [Coxiella burnetii]MCF2096677.1 AMP-binding protein [Coxiella burnetii]MCF2098725.1 AMP-binding protein [Coxiella burnetii]
MMNNITDSANLLEALEKTGKKYPQQIALTIQRDDQQVNYGYQRLLEKVDEFAARFKSANIQSGQRVVIISQNHPEAIVAYFAILKCQATAALIDINLPKKDIVQLIQAAKPSALVFSEELANLLSHTAATGYPAFDHYNNAALHVNFAKEAPLSEDETSDVATLLFTSGTTGNYKGVMLTHQNLLSQIESCRQALKITCNDRFLSVLPLHHVFPFVSSLLTPLIIGCSTMQISKIEGSFLLTAIQVHKPTILVVVPSILELFYQRIRGKINQLDSKQQKFISWLEKINQTSLNLLKLNLGKIFFRKIQNNFGGKLRYIVSGGATLDGQLHLALARLGFLILEGYGLTEVSGPCTVNRIDNNLLAAVYTLSALSRATMQWQQHPHFSGPLSITCKIFGPEFLGFGVDRLVQLLGGRGYIESNQVPQLFRDARLLRIFEGPTEMLLMYLGMFAVNFYSQLRELIQQLSPRLEISTKIAPPIKDLPGLIAKNFPQLNDEQQKQLYYLLLGKLTGFVILMACADFTEKDTQHYTLIKAWLNHQLKSATLPMAQFSPHIGISLCSDILLTEQEIAVQVDNFKQDVGDIYQGLPSEQWKLDDYLK